MTNSRGDAKYAEDEKKKEWPITDTGFLPSSEPMSLN